MMRLEWCNATIVTRYPHSSCVPKYNKDHRRLQARAGPGRPGHARAQPGLQIGTQPFCCLLSSTMNQDRFSNMALLYIERDLSSQLWDKLDDLVIRFAETHCNSKIVLL